MVKLRYYSSYFESEGADADSNVLPRQPCSRCLATYLKLVKREISFPVTVFKYGGTIKQLPQTRAYSYAFLTD